MKQQVADIDVRPNAGEMQAKLAEARAKAQDLGMELRRLRNQLPERKKELEAVTAMLDNVSQRDWVRDFGSEWEEVRRRIKANRERLTEEIPAMEVRIQELIPLEAEAEAARSSLESRIEAAILPALEEAVEEAQAHLDDLEAEEGRILRACEGARGEELIALIRRKDELPVLLLVAKKTLVHAELELHKAQAPATAAATVASRDRIAAIRKEIEAKQAEILAIQRENQRSSNMAADRRARLQELSDRRRAIEEQLSDAINSRQMRHLLHVTGGR
jgi:septal ring factor EnvC (AmiA/AmiB activator)